MNDAGDIAFRGDLSDADNPWTGRPGLWRSLRGTTAAELVALTGEPLPSDPNSTYDTFNEWPQIDEQGGVGITGRIRPCSEWASCLGIWGPGESADLELLMSGADPLPEIGPEARLSFPYVQSVNASGDSAFQGVVVGPGIDDSNNYALWATAASGELSMIKREGDPVPGFPAGTTFAPVGWGSPGEHLSFNDVGEVAFFSELAGPEITTENARTIWKWHPDGQLDLILRSGDAAPTDVPGTTFSYFSDPIMNRSGEMALLANTTDPGLAYWKRSADGDWTELLRSRNPAPGLPAGISLGLPFFGDPHPTSGEPVLSDGGSVLLDFWLEGTGVDATNDRALFLVDAAGDPTLVIRRGDPIEFSVGDVRQVSDYHIWDGSRSIVGRMSLNERNDVVALLYFTDGSEAIARFPVPEPGFASGLAWACLIVGGLAKRRHSRSAEAHRSIRARETNGAASCVRG